MRFITIILGLIYTATCMAQIDTEKLETVLNNTFQDIVGAHDFLVLKKEDGSAVSTINIDNSYTNFDLGRVKASLSTRTVPLESNLLEEIVLSAVVSTDITDTEDKRKSFDFSANATIEGNTLALLKKISTALGDCTQKPITTEDSKNPVDVANILCQVQTGVNESSTVVELQESIQNAADYAKLVYKKGSDDDNIIGDFFSSLSIDPKDGELVLKVTIDSEVGLDESETNSNKLKANVTLTLREKGVEFDVKGSAIFENSQYDEYINLVKKVATDLLDKNSITSKKQFEDKLYLVLSLIEAFLVIEEDDEDDF